jgi:DNA polymerase III delta prime subunit
MIVSTEGISGPAQNALLKITEEPAPNTFFFFIIPSKSQILPTLLSRFRELSFDLEKSRPQHPTLNAENFVKQPVSNRMEIIKEITAFLDDEKITKGEIIEFISNVVKTRYQKKESKLTKHQIKALVAIEHFMRDPSSSIKMSLEYLALNV